MSRYPTITGPVPLPGDERNADYTTSTMHRYSVVTTDPALQTALTGRTIIMFTARVTGTDVSTRSSFTGKFASRLQRYTSRALTLNCWPRMGQFTRYAQDTARSPPPPSPLLLPKIFRYFLARIFHRTDMACLQVVQFEIKEAKSTMALVQYMSPEAGMFALMQLHNFRPDGNAAERGWVVSFTRSRVTNAAGAGAAPVAPAFAAAVSAAESAINPM